MMKIIFMMFMLIPVVFNLNFWVIQSLMFYMVFIFFLNFSFNFMFLNISYMMGMDLMSFMMVLLSFWICSLMVMSSEKIYFYNNWKIMFLLVIMFLLFSLVMVFSSLNLFVFYLFFEISLIPTLILVLGWGYQPERLQAGLYLLIYTLLASLPMMISIFFCYKYNYSLDFYFMEKDLDELMLYLCMNMVFFVKIPMFFVHLWLPKAHVEAPVSGSMILAGIMLKLGGYGLMRVMPMFLSLGMKINFFFISLSMVGGFIISLICIRQSDLKSLIAYSSVCHMGLALSGILTLNFWGLSGALTMMVAHGLCSSGLFCLVNISYERLSSRSLYLNKGLINIMPSLSLWWFLLISCNMAAPPSLNLLSEVILINSILSYSFYNMLFLSLISFFSAVYSLYLYSFSQHGKIFSGLYSFSLGSMREYLLLLLHWLPLNLLVLKSELLVLWL
uniref:NADH-ubiquinone oxidoreductase chain 4 n=1 Tax=Tetratoma fungorum TaxID=296006 RepID=A0A343A448_9CUCU|nr:NADH dehydrogenase subunit 4 [Tetratoma fungorum]AOY39326.1 NADH dehydrogenase subunit 4 [Tetratoma fungorum]ARH54697.1 NADH dehydrogenase subunit 4 [Tetratoma fungorum]